ncbi:MAG TPA: alpha/beta fold hydrolase [Candidatus Acidoferrales bacterium]|nr:alpha/beta fold hydrolase [Candidatus Acidoferrales bacterium]
MFLALSAVACALSGCSIHVNPAWKPPKPSGPAQPVELFYVTDRKEAGKSQDAKAKRAAGKAQYATDRSWEGELSFGLMTACIPGNHQIGEYLRVTPRFGCEDVPGVTPGAVSQERGEFFRSIAARLEPMPRKQIFVFVHGYDFEFGEAALWAAQLKADLGFSGVAVFYSWPSLASRLRYSADENNAEWSTLHLQRFLEELAARAPGSAIHLIGHSLGCRALLRALDGIAKEKSEAPVRMFAQIIFAAPDVDSDVFRQLAPSAVRLGERVTLYTSAQDRALGTSGHLHGYPRAGDSEYELVLLPGVDTIDATAVSNSRMHHDYFLDRREMLADIFQLLENRTPPERRFALRRVQVKDGVYWRIAL